MRNTKVAIQNLLLQTLKIIKPEKIPVAFSQT